MRRPRPSLMICAMLVLTACAGAGGPIASPSPPPNSPSPNFSAPADLATNSGLPPSNTPGVTNPGVTQANIHQTICVSGWTATVRPPVSYTQQVKRQKMAALGIPWSQASLYELDHREPLETGGAPRDPANLWIEAWNGPRGARAKDIEENRVRQDVCDGRLTLAQGQAVFLGNWWIAVVP